MDLLNRCLRIEYGRPATFEIDWRHVYEPKNLSNVHIMADGQKPVTSTAIFPTTVLVGPHTIEVGGINGVGTEPAYRGTGLVDESCVTVRQACDVKVWISAC